MVLTNDAALAKRMKELRTHGSTVSADARHAGKGFLLPEFPEAGYNYRMTDIQAAVGMAQIEKLDQIVGEKRRRAAIYDKLIGQTLPEFRVPYVPEAALPYQKGISTHTSLMYVCWIWKSCIWILWNWADSSVTGCFLRWKRLGLRQGRGPMQCIC